MKKAIIYIIVLFALACTKFEKIEDFPIEPPALVANALFKEGEPFHFRISRSLSILDNAQIGPVKDAQLILFRNQQPIDTLTGANEQGTYLSIFQPERDHQYHIKVSHPRYPTIVSGFEKLPAPMIVNNFNCHLLDSVVEVYNYWSSNKADTLITNYRLECTLNLRDLGITENIYSLSVVLHDSVYNYSSRQYEWRKRSAWVLLSDDTSLLNHTGIGNDQLYSDKLFFSNHLFPGEDYSLNFTLHDNNWGNTLAREYTLLVHSYSNSSYLYARSLNFGTVGFSSPFVEPTRIFTNIENGYGIFAGIDMVTIPVRR
ncbi:MAG: DUF4249 family protein [Bacteroidales bacterium]